MNSIVATIAPQIESDIINNVNLEKYYVFFDKLFNFAEEYPQLLQIILPNEVCDFFYSDQYLRSYIEEMDSSDIGIYRLDYDFNECKLCFEIPDDLFIDGKTIQIIANQFSQNHIPILFDINNVTYIKIECEQQTNKCNSKFCKDRITLETSNLFAKQLLEAEIVKCCNQNLKLFNRTLVDKNYNISVDELKILCMYFGILFSDTLNDLHKLIDLVIIPEFLSSDIKISNYDELRIIASSITRAVLFPSIRDENPNIHSLDWHRNDLCSKLSRNKEDYFFYKIDAIEENKTGVKNSGTNRILMVKYHNKDYIVGYTKNHDFEIEFCSHKLDKLIKHINT